MRKVGSVLLVTIALTLLGGTLDTGSLSSGNKFILANSLLKPKIASAASTLTNKGKQYVVKPGDSLWTIARRNSTTVAKLKSLNHLTSDLLQIGQVLSIENNAKNQTQTNQKPAIKSSTIENKSVVSEKKDISPSRGAVDQIENLLFTAKKYLGVPYVYGGESPKGFDCSGFAQYVFNKFGIDLPRSSSQQATIGVKVTENQALPGDLVFFNTGGGKQISHVGIYLGGGKFIHASQNDGISITPLNSSYYADRLVTIKRVIR